MLAGEARVREAAACPRKGISTRHWERENAASLPQLAPSIRDTRGWCLAEHADQVDSGIAFEGQREVLRGPVEVRSTEQDDANRPLRHRAHRTPVPAIRSLRRLSVGSSLQAAGTQ